MDSQEARNFSLNRSNSEANNDVVLTLSSTHWDDSQTYVNLDKLHKRRNEHIEEEEEGDDEVDGVEDTNVFATKKSLAQGMMDVALITANANQLRYVIEFNRNSRTFYFLFAMILISIILQVIVGVLLILSAKTTAVEEQLPEESSDKHVRRNKSVLICVFVITIINVFIATFPINDQQPLTTLPH